jgi:hypothetical protein
MRRHQPGWFVIEEEPRALAHRQWVAVDDDTVGGTDVERRRGDHGAIDRNAAGADPGLGFTPRAKPGARHHLGDALAALFVSHFRSFHASWPGLFLPPTSSCRLRV